MERAGILTHKMYCIYSLFTAEVDSKDKQLEQPEYLKGDS